MNIDREQRLEKQAQTFSEFYEIAESIIQAPIRKSSRVPGADEAVARLPPNQREHFNFIERQAFEIKKQIKCKKDEISLTAIPGYVLKLKCIMDELEQLCTQLDFNYVYQIFKSIFQGLYIVSGLNSAAELEKIQKTESNSDKKPQLVFNGESYKKQKSSFGPSGSDLDTSPDADKNKIKKQKKRLVSSELRRQMLGGVALYTENYKRQIQYKNILNRFLEQLEQSRDQKQFWESLEKHYKETIGLDYIQVKKITKIRQELLEGRRKGIVYSKDNKILNGVNEYYRGSGIQGQFHTNNSVNNPKLFDYALSNEYQSFWNIDKVIEHMTIIYHNEKNFTLESIKRLLQQASNLYAQRIRELDLKICSKDQMISELEDKLYQRSLRQQEAAIQTMPSSIVKQLEMDRDRLSSDLRKAEIVIESLQEVVLRQNISLMEYEKLSFENERKIAQQIKKISYAEKQAQKQKRINAKYKVAFVQQASCTGTLKQLMQQDEPASQLLRMSGRVKIEGGPQITAEIMERNGLGGMLASMNKNLELAKTSMAFKHTTLKQILEKPLNSMNSIKQFEEAEDKVIEQQQRTSSLVTHSIIRSNKSTKSIKSTKNLKSSKSMKSINFNLGKADSRQNQSNRQALTDRNSASPRSIKLDNKDRKESPYEKQYSIPKNKLRRSQKVISIVSSKKQIKSEKNIDNTRKKIRKLKLISQLYKITINQKDCETDKNKQKKLSPKKTSVFRRLFAAKQNKTQLSERFKSELQQKKDKNDAEKSSSTSRPLRNTFSQENLRQNAVNERFPATKTSSSLYRKSIKTLHSENNQALSNNFNQKMIVNKQYRPLVRQSIQEKQIQEEEIETKPARKRARRVLDQTQYRFQPLNFSAGLKKPANQRAKSNQYDLNKISSKIKRLSNKAFNFLQAASHEENTQNDRIFRQQQIIDKNAHFSETKPGSQVRGYNRKQHTFFKKQNLY